ncbi:hypothetical protein [Legionella hackeliae]|uniref:Uncharacterized protein n=1 Tax=Legionella hackeliae TaxID=449 RepID=A0A0A8URA2_LEGHA|nr:hypothetical protein [Legionella hackeliae]KTD15371.1 hypothetical protein Lhac_0213 [Legionella hackeliae]CEK11263.1 protein of unknown function [Legionella hackeliae]STX48028.1 Uncharacterised protein [Legionella hackeliae]
MLELLVIREINSKGVSVCLKPSLAEVITPTLAREIRNLQNSIVEKYLTTPWEGYFYVIWYSHRGHGNCGRGLDFNYILNTILNGKEVAFESYIKDLFELLFLNYIGLGLPVVNCSIIDRDISGISQEFFFLNQINFIKKSSESTLENQVISVDLHEISTHQVFPKFLYQNNQFYKFSNINLKEMRKLIAGTEMRSLDEASIEEIRRIFDALQHETISEIYNMASNKLKLLKRLAKMQMSHLSTVTS